MPCVQLMTNWTQCCKYFSKQVGPELVLFYTKKLRLSQLPVYTNIDGLIGKNCNSKNFQVTKKVLKIGCYFGAIIYLVKIVFFLKLGVLEQIFLGNNVIGVTRFYMRVVWSGRSYELLDLVLRVLRKSHLVVPICELFWKLRGFLASRFRIVDF